MTHLPQSVRTSLLTCSIPGVIIAVLATMGAAFGWSGLSFSSPTYYLILAIAAWCPVSKVLMWQFWQRQRSACLVCVPTSAVQHGLAVKSGDARGATCNKEYNRGR